MVRYNGVVVFYFTHFVFLASLFGMMIIEIKRERGRETGMPKLRVAGTCSSFFFFVGDSKGRKSPKSLSEKKRVALFPLYLASWWECVWDDGAHFV